MIPTLLLLCLFTLPCRVIGTSRPTARPTTSLRPTAIGTKLISTGFNRKYVVPGSVFSVHAKIQAIAIKSFDISMAGPPSPNPAPVEIYVLRYLDPGDRSARSDYQLILQRNIIGAGYSLATSLPDLSTPVVIPSGATYSFYITIANMTLGTTLGVGTLGAGVFASDEYLDVSDGYSLSYPFGLYTADKRWCGKCFPQNTLSKSLQMSCFYPRFFTGNIYYSIMTASPTSKPSLMPSPKPSTKSPTSQPSSKPTIMTLKPTEQTLKPTAIQTDPPSPVPTMKPSAMPQTVTPTSSTPSIKPTSLVKSLIPHSRNPTRSPTSLELAPTISPTSYYDTILDKYFPKKPTRAPTKLFSSAKKDVIQPSSTLLYLLTFCTIIGYINWW
jgi:hypothetical protein